VPLEREDLFSITATERAALKGFRLSGTKSKVTLLKSTAGLQRVCGYRNLRSPNPLADSLWPAGLWLTSFVADRFVPDRFVPDRFVADRFWGQLGMGDRKKPVRVNPNILNHSLS
jgi:hypothetical protein